MRSGLRALAVGLHCGSFFIITYSSSAIQESRYPEVAVKHVHKASGTQKEMHKAQVHTWALRHSGGRGFVYFLKNRGPTKDGSKVSELMI